MQIMQINTNWKSTDRTELPPCRYRGIFDVLSNNVKETDSQTSIKNIGGLTSRLTRIEICDYTVDMHH